MISQGMPKERDALFLQPKLIVSKVSVSQREL